MLMIERALPAWSPLASWALGGAVAGIVIGIIRELRPGSLRRLVAFICLLGMAWWVGEANGWIAVSGQVRDILGVPRRPAQTPGEAPGSAVVASAQGATVRAAPSISARRVGSLGHGMKVRILARVGDWYQIQSGTIQGYMHSSLLSPQHSSSIPPAENEPQSTAPALNKATVLLRSQPPATVSVNDLILGQTEVLYAAMPREKLRIRFAAEGFDLLELEQTAPPEGAMMIIEHLLRPVDFPYGRWRCSAAGTSGEFLLARGPLNYLTATLTLPGQDDTHWRGRYDPVGRTLLLLEVTNEATTGRVKVTLHADLRQMTGQWFAHDDAEAARPFEANWVGGE